MRTTTANRVDRPANKGVNMLRIFTPLFQF